MLKDFAQMLSCSESREEDVMPSLVQSKRIGLFLTGSRLAQFITGLRIRNA